MASTGLQCQSLTGIEEQQRLFHRDFSLAPGVNLLVFGVLLRMAHARPVNLCNVCYKVRSCSASTETYCAMILLASSQVASTFGMMWLCKALVVSSPSGSAMRIASKTGRKRTLHDSGMGTQWMILCRTTTHTSAPRKLRGGLI